MASLLTNGVSTSQPQQVFALKEIGVVDAVGVASKASLPLVKYGKAFKLPFSDDIFDFVFVGGGPHDGISKPLESAAEIGRTLKPQGVLVVHTVSARDKYNFNSFIGLFSCCSLVRSHDIHGIDSSAPSVREIVLRKEIGGIRMIRAGKVEADSKNKCSTPEYKLELVQNAEPLIKEEPLKPRITLKKNIQNPTSAAPQRGYSYGGLVELEPSFSTIHSDGNSIKMAMPPPDCLFFFYVWLQQRPQHLQIASMLGDKAWISERGELMTAKRTVR